MIACCLISTYEAKATLQYKAAQINEDVLIIWATKRNEVVLIKMKASCVLLNEGETLNF